MTVIVGGPPSQSVLGNLSPLYRAYPNVRLLFFAFSLMYGVHLSVLLVQNYPEYMIQMHWIRSTPYLYIGSYLLNFLPCPSAWSDFISPPSFHYESTLGIEKKFRSLN